MFNRIGCPFPPPVTPIRLLPVAVILLALACTAGAQNSCSCTNCPQVLPDNFTGDFYIQVQNAANPLLGQNGQAVCGVVLHFDHEYLGDLQITLTSPAGQTVTLIGPTGFFGETDGTEWDVAFVPCNTPANPDPGFSTTWNNDQTWGVFGDYSGSYYPYAGCLQDFNTGPVNGQWTLSVTDQLPGDGGNFYGYQIIFCDPAGIDCYSCAASAGNLLQPDLAFCAGDTALQLKLPPTYPAQQNPPPAGTYSYTYVVGSGGVIQGYDPGPDLSNYPPGMYTLCGLSYLTADTAKIPAPNDTLTIAELTARLNSSNPPFCGEVSDNCVNVDILPIPEAVFDTAVVCAPDCYVYYDTSFCDSGIHTIRLFSNGCPYPATLHLTVLQPVLTEIYESICPGSCAQTPGFENRCTQGVYTRTLPGANGCDSIVTLYLSVPEAVAAIVPPQALSCAQNAVPLLGSGSTAPAPGVTYLWTAFNNGVLQGPADQMDAVAGAAGGYRLLVCNSGGGVTCCDTTEAFVVTNQNPPGVPGGINGPDTLCLGQIIDFQVDTAQFAASYTWSVPAGVLINSGQGAAAINLTWAAGTGGAICVYAENACGVSSPVCRTVQVNDLPSEPVIAGPDTLCAGSTAVYAIAPIAGAGGYDWEIAGGMITGKPDSTVVEVVWKDTAGTICVSALNHCGAGPKKCLAVTLLSRPGANAGTDSAVCGDRINLHALVQKPDTGGFWKQIAGPGTVFLSDSTDANALVKVSTPGTYLFEWSQTNGVCTGTDTAAMTFRSLPVIGTPAYICDAANENYTASVSIAGGTAPYEVNGSSLPGNTYISPWLPGGAPFSIVVTDTFGCSATFADTFNCECTSFAGAMSAQIIEACEGQQVFAQYLGGRVLDGNDTAIYILHNYAGDNIGQVISQNHTGVFEFLPGMSFDTVYYISLVVGNNKNGLPDMNDPCLSVSPGQPAVFHPRPQVYAGVDTALCGNMYLLQATPPVGQWSYSTVVPGGVLDFDDAQTGSTLVTASVPGMYAMQWTVVEKGCTAGDSIYIQFNEQPSVADIQYVCDTINENYTVQLTIENGQPPYLINGADLSSGLFISMPFASGSSYSFMISDNNKCISPEISGVYTCSCVTAAGAMSPDTVVVCETDSAQAVSLGDYSLDGNDALEYVLHTAPGAALGQVLARNKTGAFSFMPGMLYDEVYYISLVAGNETNGAPNPADPCFSVAPGQPVTFLRKPQPDAGPDRALCGLEAGLEVQGSLFSGYWSVAAGPGNAAFTPKDSASALVKVSGTGNYIFRWTETNGQCAGTDEVDLRFNSQPLIQNLKADCNGTNTGFILRFDLLGGTPPFKVDGLTGLFNGPAFLSLLIPNSTTYAFTVSDANGCATPAVSGSKYCACTTSAGTMSATPLVFCEGADAVAEWNNDAVSDADDVVRFILHDQPGATPGNILAIDTQPVFPFTANLKTGITYYISAIAGNDSGGNVGLDDPCLSVAPGTPVQWKPAPAATLSGDTTICRGQPATLVFSGTGVFPLTVSYKDGTGAVSTLILPGQAALNVTVAPANTVTYTLLGVTDGGGPVCETPYQTGVTVWVNEPPQAGLPAPALEICANTPRLIALDSLLNGAQSGGVWTEVSGQSSGPGAFQAGAATFNTAAQPPGLYLFRYAVAGQAPCGADSAVAGVRIRPSPEAVAGPDAWLDCHILQVWLGDSLSNPGGDVVYEWYLNDQVLPGAGGAVLSVDTAGVYRLRATNLFGCSDADTAVVAFSAPPLEVQALNVSPVRCKGEKNGRIRIDSVFGGTPPLRYALDNGTFQINPDFERLAPGAYLVRIQDAEGCEWVSAPLFVDEPPEIKIDLGDDIEAAFGDSLYLLLETSLPAAALDTIIWQPLLDSNAAGKPFQHFFPLHSGKTTARVIDTNGCRAEDDIQWVISRERRVYVPNAFKPESDQNSVFYLSAGHEVEEVELLQIFDRWGDKVFEMRQFQPGDPSKGWNGEVRGAKAPPGVYGYFAKIRFKDGEEEAFTGNVTLLR